MTFMAGDKDSQSMTENLASRLSEIRHAFENGTTPPEIVQVLNAHVERMVASGVADQALKVGDAAPLSQQIAGRNCSLGDLMGESGLVLTWFRGNW
ncbi:hypothetical protein [Mariniblastus fucicola]|uniref:Uncharacterized protein n=1 Tax=Mariniblastus fucicola TaxID=980251 RepID=A0A5B9PG46_9BACT|nr:hypothetical protein [Mariniblastus fucicola]QEG24569.1 hypothetical protein MFFC18_44900 [Mariniblastus fucicola]